MARSRFTRWWWPALGCLLGALWLPPGALAASATPPDFPAPNGRYFTQTNGASVPSLRGYLVTDSSSARMWSEFQRLGGVQVVGYPVSSPFQMDGFTVQAFQKFILQWHPESNQVQFVNVFDKLHDAGKDAFLLNVRQTPPPADTAADAGKSWPQVVAAHQALLDGNAAIKAAYFGDAGPISHYGLPMTGPVDEGNVIVVRAQRATFQQWKQAVPWAAAGQVTVANGGDIAKEAGLVPLDAALPGYPSIAWVPGGPVRRDAPDLNLAPADLPGYTPFTPASATPPPSLQDAQKSDDATLAPLDAHGQVNGSSRAFANQGAPGRFLVVSTVEVYGSAAGAQWRFADLVAKEKAGLPQEQQVGVAKVGDDTLGLRADDATPSGGKFTFYAVLFRSGNVVGEVSATAVPGQGSIDGEGQLAQLIVGRAVAP